MTDSLKIANIIYPDLFNTNYIYVYYELNDELKEIIERSGYKNEFTRKYKKCLRFLDNLKEKCTMQRSFEKLLECDGLYSMRLIGEKNIRIIFTFMECNTKGCAVLLCAFQEKDSKTGSRTSYNAAIALANSRIKNLKM